MSNPPPRRPHEASTARSDEPSLDPAGSPRPVTLLTFIKDDREALRRLVPRIDAALVAAGLRARLLVIDDGSREPLDALELEEPLNAIGRVDALVLARNLGHQRAIAVGLCHLAARSAAEERDESDDETALRPDDLVVVMDADGEDRPEDVPRLVEAARAEPGALAFAARSRRVEGPAFRVGYRCYQVLHWLLTGRGIRVGNFSCVPASRLKAIGSNPDIWNHYAAAVFAGSLPTVLVPCRRAPRLAGRSRLDLVALVTHGLAAISCHRERVVVRLAAVMALALAASVAVLAVLIGGAVGGAPSPAAMLAAGFVALLSLQVLAACGLATLVLLSQRSTASVLPLRDHEAFIDRRLPLLPAPGD